MHWNKGTWEYRITVSLYTVETLLQQIVLHPIDDGGGGGVAEAGGEHVEELEDARLQCLQLAVFPTRETQQTAVRLLQMVDAHVQFLGDARLRTQQRVTPRRRQQTTRRTSLSTNDVRGNCGQRRDRASCRSDAGEPRGSGAPTAAGRFGWGRLVGLALLLRWTARCRSSRPLRLEVVHLLVCREHSFGGSGEVAVGARVHFLLLRPARLREEMVRLEVGAEEVGALELLPAVHAQGVRLHRVFPLLVRVEGAEGASDVGAPVAVEHRLPPKWRDDDHIRQLRSTWFFHFHLN